jgi:signal transduction histidine kinase
MLILNYISYLSAGLSLLLTVVAFIIYSKGKKAIKILDLEKQELKKKITSQEIESREKILAEMASEWHDNINQMLSATRLYLDVAIRKSIVTNKPDSLKMASDLLGSAINEIRKMTRGILPNLDERSLTDVISEDLTRIKETGALETTIVIIGTPFKLSDDKNLAIYRIYQECVTNIVRHSCAKNVKVEFTYKESFIFSIKDDGKGFDPALTSNGIGLHNIKSRALLMEGKLGISSKPGEGTTIQLTV